MAKNTSNLLRASYPTRIAKLETIMNNLEVFWALLIVTPRSVKLIKFLMNRIIWIE